MEIARRELGVTEVPGKASNQRILEYHKHTRLLAQMDEVNWCSAFANFVMETAGYVGTRSPLARSWLDWGVKIEQPSFGCIVVLKRGYLSWQGHVGFLERTVGTDRLRILGGNQGNRVSVGTFRRADVLGYRLPPPA
jgi:uncharacterized protein (TIGR02594 family)